jgi:hypothetical protein
VAAAREAPSLQRKHNLWQTKSDITEWIGAKIYTRWMNELELGRLFGTPPDLMLGLRKTLEPVSILALAKRMVRENVTERDRL